MIMNWEERRGSLYHNTESKQRAVKQWIHKNRSEKKKITFTMIFVYYYMGEGEAMRGENDGVAEEKDRKGVCLLTKNIRNFGIISLKNNQTSLC